MFGGKTLAGFSFTGRTQNYLYYREIGPGGVRLHGFTSPGVITVTYDPPLQEYPPEASLKVGATWGGQSKVTTTPVQGKPEEVTLVYAYRVLEERDYRVGSTVYPKALLINLEQRLSNGDTVNQAIRFLPKIGEVRTREGLALIARSF